MSVIARRVRWYFDEDVPLEQGVWADEDLFALVEWTVAPVCVADISESSVALMTGLDTSGHRWQAWLNRATPRLSSSSNPRTWTT